MKLEPNMYVRTKDGKIAKFIKYDEKAKEELVTDYYEYSTIWIKDVIKASNNIIDLIEVGDYVNGLRVEKNKYGELYTSYVYYGGDIGKQCEVYTNWLKEFKEDMIYSVVTHEQMEQMEYKVGD